MTDQDKIAALEARVRALEDVVRALLGPVVDPGNTHFFEVSYGGNSHVIHTPDGGLSGWMTLTPAPAPGSGYARRF